MNICKNLILFLCVIVITPAQSSGKDIIFKNDFEETIISIVASTSFEEIDASPFDGIKYTDTGDASMAHDLVNNSGEPPVDLSGGIELGVDASYFPYDTEPGDGWSGLTDGDFVGVTTYTGDVESYTDGVQGYQLSDVDGNMILEFDVVDLTNHSSNTLAIDYYINSVGFEGDGTTNIEENDRIRIYVKDLTNLVEIDILNTEGSNISALGISGSWVPDMINIPDNIMAQLVVELRSNGSTEALYLDNIVISGEQL